MYVSLHLLSSFPFLFPYFLSLILFLCSILTLSSFSFVHLSSPSFRLQCSLHPFLYPSFLSLLHLHLFLPSLFSPPFKNAILFFSNGACLLIFSSFLSCLFLYHSLHLSPFLLFFFFPPFKNTHLLKTKLYHLRTDRPLEPTVGP